MSCTRFGTIKEKEQHAITRDLMKRLEQDIDPKTPVGDLRIGQQQIIEIAKALAQNVRILIMDEPTSALSNTEVEVLFRIIRELKAHDVSIVYISHKLDELLHIGDTFTVLRDGMLVAEAPAADISLNWIVEKMVGRRADSLFTHSDHTLEQEVLRVEDLTLPRVGGGYVVDHVSFTLHAGEVVGIYGLMGAGRTELLESLIGLNPEARGTICAERQKSAWAGHQVADRARFVACPRRSPTARTGAKAVSGAQHHPRQPVALSALRGACPAAKERASVTDEISDLHIKVADPNDLITALSGGNQQKVVVGKSLLTNPKVLMLDEPTRGIDVAAKGEIFEIINQLAQQGLGVLFVSSELKEVLATADRVLVMWKGRITAEFKKGEITQEAVAAASVGALMPEKVNP